MLDRRQYARLIVDKNVMLGRITPLDVVEGFFLMNIDQHTSIDRVSKTGALDFMRLKDDVTVRQDDGQAEADPAVSIP